MTLSQKLPPPGGGSPDPTRHSSQRGKGGGKIAVGSVQRSEPGIPVATSETAAPVNTIQRGKGGGGTPGRRTSVLDPELAGRDEPAAPANRTRRCFVCGRTVPLVRDGPDLFVGPHATVGVHDARTCPGSYRLVKGW